MPNIFEGFLVVYWQTAVQPAVCVMLYVRQYTQIMTEPRLHRLIISEVSEVFLTYLCTCPAHIGCRQERFSPFARLPTSVACIRYGNGPR